MRQPRRTTDFGTVIFHLLLVATFCVLLATGLRIATDDPESSWLASLDPLLPVRNLWFYHLFAGCVFVAVIAAYVVYLRQARLTARVRFDKARILTIFRPGRTRWAALNVIVYWVLVAALVTEVVTGVMLFVGAGGALLWFHLQATFVACAMVFLHVSLHALYGGFAQVLRIVRPAALHIAEPPPDLAELLAEQLSRSAVTAAEIKSVSVAKRVHATKPAADKRPPPAQSPRRATVRIQAHPFASAVAVSFVAGGIAIGAEQATRPVLHVVEIDSSEAPVLDGDLSDSAWTKAKPVKVLTTQGGDFGGTHQSMVEIRAVHDGQFAYFAFVWEDPTRSLKDRPLVKLNGQWQVLGTAASAADDERYREDKFAVLLTRPGLPLIGAAIHLARQPLSDLPPSVTGRGLHYTVDGSIADVWQWRASHGGPTGYIDNCHIGGPKLTNAANASKGVSYAGGFSLDPGPVPHQSNIRDTLGALSAGGFLPRLLPRDVAAQKLAMGQVRDGPGESDGEGSRWWMTVGESVPYSAAADAKIPNGTMIPGISVLEESTETRSSIRGTARWAAGRWTLELVRRIHTGSQFDIPIKSGVLMWVAAFDHSEKRHTRHLRPFTLEVE